MYKENRIVQASEIGYNNQIRIKDIIDIIQDLESSHIDSIKPLSASMKNDNFGILLNFRYVHMNSWPKYRDELVLTTSPYETKGFYGYRNSVIKNIKDEVMIESYCLGSFINLETLKPHRISQEVVEAIKDAPKHEMNYIGRKIDLNRELNYIGESIRNVESSNLDYYQHLNNAFYVEFAYNQLPLDFEFDTLICEYKLAFNYKEKMILKTYQTSTGYLVKFYNEQENLNVMIEFKKGQ